MLDYSKKASLFLLTAFVLTAISFSSAQASFWDVIRAWVTINPLDLDLSAPNEVEINKTFQVRAKAINKGGEKIENVKGEIFLPSGLSLLGKDSVKEIGIIPPKKEKNIRWSVKGKEIGNYFILVLVSGELKEDKVSAEDSLMIKVIKPLPKGRAPGWLQNLFELFWQRFKL